MLSKLLLAIVGLAAYTKADEVAVKADASVTGEGDQEEEKDEGPDYKAKFVANAKKAACYVYTDLEFYDLTKLQNETPWTATGLDGKTYSWHFCHFEPFCEGNENIAIAAATTPATTAVPTIGCELLSGKGSSSIKRELKQKGDTVDKSLYITYSGGAICRNDDTKTHDLEIKLLCDAKEPGSVTSINTSDPCLTVIKMKSTEGCPKFSSTAIVAFLSENPWALAILMIVFGSVVCFFGRRFLKWTLAALGFLFGAGVVLLLMSFAGLLDGLQNSDESPLWLAIVCLIIGLALGGLTGLLLYKTWMVGACVLAAIAGVFGMIALYNLLFAATDNFWILLVMIIGGAVGAVILTRKYFDMLVMISTSVLGSYSLVRGISMFAGGFPNELVLMDKLANGMKPELDNSFYIYIAVMVTVFILGFLKQRKVFKEEASSKNGGFAKVE
jgi:hypothetical protein